MVDEAPQATLKKRSSLASWSGHEATFDASRQFARKRTLQITLSWALTDSFRLTRRAMRAPSLQRSGPRRRRSQRHARA